MGDVNQVQVDGLVMHMPGNWQWVVELQTNGEKKTLTKDFKVQ